METRGTLNSAEFPGISALSLLFYLIYTSLHAPRSGGGQARTIGFLFQQRSYIVIHSLHASYTITIQVMREQQYLLRKNSLKQSSDLFVFTQFAPCDWSVFNSLPQLPGSGSTRRFAPRSASLTIRSGQEGKGKLSG